jgi:UPF0755 protein
VSETVLSEPPRPPGRTHWLRALLLLTLFVGAAGIAGLLWWQRQLTPAQPPAAAQEVEFEVEAGWGAARVATALEDAGLVRDARVFRLYLQLQGLDREVGEGLYLLSPALSTPQIADRLGGGGRPRVRTVVIPEGFRAGQVAQRLRAELALDVAGLIETPGALRPEFVPPEAGLEGYLFPASYEIPLGSSPEGALELMLGRFARELTPAVRRELRALGLSVHEWVTLASMVQAEAGSREEMPIIAGVFLNRLDRGMRLQSDPTVAYGLGKRLPDLDAASGDLRQDTPWNTYTRAGLPRGPIGNPGHHALQVIFQAQRRDASGAPYLYFLHGLDGSFRPNLTLDDHNRDVEAFLR